MDTQKKKTLSYYITNRTGGFIKKFNFHQTMKKLMKKNIRQQLFSLSFCSDFCLLFVLFIAERINRKFNELFRRKKEIKMVKVKMETKANVDFSVKAEIISSDFVIAHFYSLASEKAENLFDFYYWR